jgi:hypothetical protein
VGQEQAEKINGASVRHRQHELQRTAFVVDPKWVIGSYVVKPAIDLGLHAKDKLFFLNVLVADVFLLLVFSKRSCGYQRAESNPPVSGRNGL